MKRPLTAEQLLRMQRAARQSGKDARSAQQAVLRQAQESMNESQKAQLQSILQDKEALQKLMQSEQAQQVLRRLKGSD